ncbi:bifunctional UDP-N-acetylglucosamine diphosphorylase/glucosamine-1-phosphate N-acetyltransferase GlmU [Ferriphaselus sp. R-1]|uniref:bifunctional UDP-N-acetylglucosamine diphosphorylase/glucosamine-1-phosphate N-acetyltransferase GlmU n=1 Tax=Ferriphaselus sp. R-1 TaxID=1485544 RepID=UPI0005548C16|nr:bifunctional UDP-N-acetylglucosamine diphosphorylase/glucosamine-1-phosphate N-acetyltransferase GlmU [Ferriphaselus sp. R-1]
MNSLNIIILAAGKGTRMHSDKPKVLHALAGRPLVGHVLETASMMSPGVSCVVYGHGGEQVPLALAGLASDFVLQEPQLGTGHAVQQAMPLLDDDSTTLILYGDVPLIQAATLHPLLMHPSALNLLTLHLEHPTGYGRIVRDDDGHVVAIVEEKDATTEQRRIREVNTGILAAPTGLLRGWLNALKNNNAQGEYYLTDIVAMAVAQGVSVHTAQPAHEWEVLGVNSKQQLADLERLWQRVQANHLLAQGVTLVDPGRIDIRGKLTCGRDVEIDIGCIFEGNVHLDHRVRVGAYSVIRESSINSGTHIAPFSLIDHAEVGNDCVIGPYARLRPGTKLHNEVHVGNFVEIKNSEIAAQSKANHLSYIGDSTVGSRVNIGAGTITCNYDGANKHRTVIGDDAFIGSDTQLVAPVTVGRGATIGAGSTITRDTPEHELTLSRSKQLTIAGWQRPKKKPR